MLLNLALVTGLSLITTALAVNIPEFHSFRSTTADLHSNVGRDAPPEFRGKRSFVERDGVKRTIFEHAATNTTIDFVKNSGICETTPGVNQYSGYVSVGRKLIYPFQENRDAGGHWQRNDGPWTY
jgi:hypothetical protein